MQEKRYPRPLMSVLAAELSPDLLELFEQNKESWIIGNDIVDYVEALWTDKLADVETPDDFRKARKALRSKCSRRKKQWLDSLKASVAVLPRDSDKHPFKHVIDIHRNLSKEQWGLLYGGMSLDDILRDELDRAQAWAADPGSFLTGFPAFPSFSRGRMQVSFENDVLLNTLDIAERKYDFRIDDYSHSYAEFMTDVPMFSEKAKWLPKAEDGEDVEYSIPMSEDGTRTLLMTVSAAFGSQTSALSMLDEKDNAVLSVLINRADRSIDPTVPFSISVSDLAKTLMPSNNKLGQQQYAWVEKRVFRLANTTFTVFDERGRQTAAINLLDSAVLRKDGSRLLIDITLGSRLAQAIMDQNIRRIQNDTIALISSSIGRIIIMALQRERIRAYSRAGNREELRTTLGYENFLAMVNFGSSSKRRNWRVLKETLIDDFVGKGIYIRNVVFDDVRHTAEIEWIPFTDDELKELRWTGYAPEAIEVDASEEPV